MLHPEPGSDIEWQDEGCRHPPCHWMLHSQPGSDIEWQDECVDESPGRRNTAATGVLLHGRMDLPGLTDVRVARSRADLVLSGTVAPLGGGTWLYSEPQPHLTGLVDLT